MAILSITMARDLRMLMPAMGFMDMGKVMDTVSMDMADMDIDMDMDIPMSMVMDITMARDLLMLMPTMVPMDMATMDMPLSIMVIMHMPLIPMPIMDMAMDFITNYLLDIVKS